MVYPQRNVSAFDADPRTDTSLRNEWGLGGLAGRVASGIGRVASSVAGAVQHASIIDLTAQADRSVRKGQRSMSKVQALVLHQMACCHQRRNPLTDYLGLKAHFAILPDGRILQMHPVDQVVWASNGFNARSVAVEFAGNFPNTKGVWWQGAKFGRDQVTPEQIAAGRRLVRHLVATMGLRTVLAHRQSSATRENDPGPDIWHGVGQWAVDTLGLSDGGPGFKIGDGNAIPELWRTWGEAKPGKPSTAGKPEKEAWSGESAGSAESIASEEAELEAAFGPLTATLKWYTKPYTHQEVVSRFRDVGGVYIAIVPNPPPGLPKILKVGMASTFARRMADKEYTALKLQHPTLSFYLAEVRGNRGNRGIAGVVRMVELALARLLRRAGALKGPGLPNAPTPLRGSVRVDNVLPHALDSLLGNALFKSQSKGSLFTGTLTPGRLALPVQRGQQPPFMWEAEPFAMR